MGLVGANQSIRSISGLSGHTRSRKIIPTLTLSSRLEGFGPWVGDSSLNPKP